MASLAVYAQRFPPDRFATLAGLQIGIGTIGTLLATAPLAFSTATIGWRDSFLAVGAFTLRARTAGRGRRQGRCARARAGGRRLRESLAGMLAVIRTPSVGRLFVMHLVVYSSFALIVGLWGGPYLAHIYGYGLEERGDLPADPGADADIGSLLWGPTDRLAASHKLPVLVGAVTTAAALGCLALAGTLSPFMLVVWFAAFGFLCAYAPVLIAHGKALFPPHQVGRGLTVLNMGSMGGMFLAQAVSGFVIELFPTAPDGAYPLTPIAWYSACRRLYPIGMSRLFRFPRSHGRARKAPREAVCIERGPRHAQRRVNILTFPLALCAVRCILLRCGSASRYRRPPWAFPP